MVKLDIILKNTLIVLHLEVVDIVFGICCGVNGFELYAEDADNSCQLSSYTRVSSDISISSKNSKAVPRR